MKCVDSLDLHVDLLEYLKNERISGSWIGDTLATRAGNAEYDKKGCRMLQGLQAFSAGNKTDFDMAAAVHRQAGFALKMSQYGWLHCPSLESTLEQAIVRYLNFFSLLAEKPEGIVPALDVDLIWHTHQLSPAVYASFCKAMANGRFINHNDAVEKGILRSDAQHSRRLYKERFGEEYFRCHSWYCEWERFLTRRLSSSDMEKIRTLIDAERGEKISARPPTNVGIGTMRVPFSPGPRASGDARARRL